MNEWKFLYTLLSWKNDPKVGNRTKWQVQKQKKNIIIGEDLIPYPDGAETMDEDSDRKIGDVVNITYSIVPKRPGEYSNINIFGNLILYSFMTAANTKMLSIYQV